MAESAGPWTSPSRRSEYLQLVRPMPWTNFMERSDMLSEHIYPLLLEALNDVTSGELVPPSQRASDAQLARQEYALTRQRLAYRAEGMRRFARILVGMHTEMQDQDIAHNLHLAGHTPGGLADGFANVAVEYEQMLKIAKTAGSSQLVAESQGLAEGFETSLLLFGQTSIVEACRKAVGQPPEQR